MSNKTMLVTLALGAAIALAGPAFADKMKAVSAELDELIAIYRAAIEALKSIDNVLQASNLASNLADFLSRTAAAGSDATGDLAAE